MPFTKTTGDAETHIRDTKVRQENDIAPAAGIATPQEASYQGVAPAIEKEAYRTDLAAVHQEKESSRPIADARASRADAREC